MPVLPQNVGMYAKQQIMQQQMLSNKRPMSALETELASVTVPMNSSILQTHAPVNLSASPKPPTLTPPPPAAVPQQTLAGNFPAGLSSPISGQTYSFNPVAGRPPVPTTNPKSAPNTPGKTTFDASNPTAASPTSMASAPVSAAYLGPDHAGSVAALAAAVIAARMQLPVSDNESSSGQSNRWSDADSDHSDDANLELNDPPAATAATAAATTMDSTISPDTLQQYQKQRKQLPLPPPVSSLLDSSPVDDPVKRLVGYQLAIYDRVSSAINKSREIHTRVNRELLDQSANLNSGAGVISEERKQLMGSQKQLTANISVLESKLAELGAKKREFPEDSKVVDVAGVFRGVGVMEQLFDLAAEIAAIDDTLYLLGKGLNDGRVSLSVYMRQVRKLAQQQFLAKALALKIRGLSNL
ncbi:Vps23 core domain-containing protein, partial [Kickxella alabastrina]|uniref:Vps23 core domain-containing protein n=1 Tax=Kickxella alabastrina TaxID=61397 RepID=UPI0022201422